VATFLFILIAYLIGSLSFAVIVSKAFGLPDPHTYGSGNPGATNVLRTGNKLAAVLTLLGDGAKGWLAVFLARAFAWKFHVDDVGIAAVALVFSVLFIVYSTNGDAEGLDRYEPFLFALGAYLIGLPVYWYNRGRMTPPGPVPAPVEVRAS